jgi:hypothetical protein
MLELPAVASAPAIIAAIAAAAGGAWLIAIIAIDRAIIARLEWYLRLASAVCANGCEHFALAALAAIAAAALLVLPRGAAIRAASRRVGEPFACVEGLLSGSKDELLTTIAALQCLVTTRSVRNRLKRHET